MLPEKRIFFPLGKRVLLSNSLPRAAGGGITPGAGPPLLAPRPHPVIAGRQSAALLVQHEVHVEGAVARRLFGGRGRAGGGEQQREEEEERQRGPRHGASGRR